MKKKGKSSKQKKLESKKPNLHIHIKVQKKENKEESLESTTFFMLL